MVRRTPLNEKLVVPPKRYSSTAIEVLQYLLGGTKVVMQCTKIS